MLRRYRSRLSFVPPQLSTAAAVCSTMSISLSSLAALRESLRVGLCLRAREASIWVTVRSCRASSTSTPIPSGTSIARTGCIPPLTATRPRSRRSRRRPTRTRRLWRGSRRFRAWDRAATRICATGSRPRACRGRGSSLPSIRSPSAVVAPIHCACWSGSAKPRARTSSSCSPRRASAKAASRRCPTRSSSRPAGKRRRLACAPSCTRTARRRCAPRRSPVARRWSTASS